MDEQVMDVPGISRRPGRGLRARAHDARAAERWGYIAWSVIAVTISIPEATAGIDDKVPWPTISSTVGELEWLWSPTAILVVALLVFTTMHAVRSPAPDAGARPGRGLQGRTRGGRFTMRADRASRPRGVVSPLAYYPLAVLVVIAGSLIAAQYGTDVFLVGYVLWGLIATFCVVIPSLLAVWNAWDVPFPTLFRTIANLERRFHFVAVILAVGLVVLLVHLAFFPWPDIAHILQAQQPTPTST